MTGQPELYTLLSQLAIPYVYREHPPAATIEDALLHWKDLDSGLCKNIFFRNHKGNRHYLVILEHHRQLDIHDLEKKLKQGKLSFASDQRLMKYLGLTPGSVSPFGLLNDKVHNVHVFIDENLKSHARLAFHPNDNRATLVIAKADLLRFMEHCGNSFEFIRLYD